MSTITVGMIEPEAIFTEESRDCSYRLNDEWLTHTHPLVDDVIYQLDGIPNLRSVIYRHDDVVVWLRHNTSNNLLQASLSSKSYAALTLEHKKLKDEYPQVEYKEDKIVPVKFWWNTRNRGPTSWTRPLAIDKWEEIGRNYVDASLDRFMHMDEPKDSGKLVLWHGQPGTGKTWAIRALGWEWRNWCKVEYITDPEAFFGEADYMMHVLMDDEGAGYIGEQPEGEQNKKWRILVIEDANELIEVDAKRQTGQALGRLLNVAEGLIGQGLQVLFLITTNEKLSELHPAVSRPGRCLAEMHFEKFTPVQATEWLGQKTDKAMTLAELYQARGDVVHFGSNGRVPVGFRR